MKGTLLICVLLGLAVPGVAVEKKTVRRKSAVSASAHSPSKAANVPARTTGTSRSASTSAKSHSTRTVASTGSARPGLTRTASRTSGKKSARNRKPVHRGQQGIDNERARQIQEALIREKYLDGEPSGAWDQRTKTAMTKFQADNGWQSRVVPDARALIKLGLGPNHANLINPSIPGSSAVLPDSARDMQPGGGSALNVQR